jgi:uncharacterized protein (TIGR03118 family)
MRHHRWIAAGLLALSLGSARIVTAAPLGYVQTNLTSSVDGMAANLDPNLKNPWGMSFSATSPFWVSDQATGVATLYNNVGVPQTLVVTIPAGPPGPNGPTGTVFVGGQGFINSATGTAANFAFASLQGTVSAWNSGTSAVTQFTATDGAVYTGLAVNGTKLYVADSANGKIDVLNQTFQKTSVSGSFVDPNVPAGFTPYNVQTIDGKLYVEYFQRFQPGGYIGVFDADGNLLQHISDPHFNSPWGVTIAPSGFGDFANALLVGNFGDGMINAFNPATGAFLGTLSDSTGQPIVNSGLWALGFRAPGGTFDPNALYFNAGINNETDGLFGTLTPVTSVPEPATLSLVALGLAASLRSRRKTA